MVRLSTKQIIEEIPIKAIQPNSITDIIIPCLDFDFLFLDLVLSLDLTCLLRAAGILRERDFPILVVPIKLRRKLDQLFVESNANMLLRLIHSFPSYHLSGRIIQYKLILSIKKDEGQFNDPRLFIYL
jgi:hypothetical protein